MLVKRPLSSFTTIPSPFAEVQATACSTRALGTASSSLVLGLLGEEAIPGDAVAAALEIGLPPVEVDVAGVKKPSV